MRKLLPIFAIGILITALVAQASAKPSQQAVAVKAVKEAVGEKYPLLATVPAGIKLRGTHVTVSCHRQTAIIFKCSWRGSNDVPERATGAARATVYVGSSTGFATLNHVKTTCIGLEGWVPC